MLLSILKVFFILFLLCGSILPTTASEDEPLSDEGKQLAAAPGELQAESQVHLAAAANDETIAFEKTQAAPKTFCSLTSIFASITNETTPNEIRRRIITENGNFPDFGLLQEMAAREDGAEKIFFIDRISRQAQRIKKDHPEFDGAFTLKLTCDRSDQRYHRYSLVNALDFLIETFPTLSGDAGDNPNLRKKVADSILYLIINLVFEVPEEIDPSLPQEEAELNNVSPPKTVAETPVEREPVAEAAPPLLQAAADIRATETAVASEHVATVPQKAEDLRTNDGAPMANELVTAADTYTISLDGSKWSSLLSEAGVSRTTLWDFISSISGLFYGQDNNSAVEGKVLLQDDQSSRFSNDTKAEAELKDHEFNREAEGDSFSSWVPVSYPILGNAESIDSTILKGTVLIVVNYFNNNKLDYRPFKFWESFFKEEIIKYQKNPQEDNLKIMSLAATQIDHAFLIRELQVAGESRAASGISPEEFRELRYQVNQATNGSTNGLLNEGSWPCVIS